MRMRMRQVIANNRHNRAPIARVVAQEYFRLGKSVLS
jgi:hypothetical protein